MSLDAINSISATQLQTLNQLNARGSNSGSGTSFQDIYQQELHISVFRHLQQQYMGKVVAVTNKDAEVIAPAVAVDFKVKNDEFYSTVETPKRQLIDTKVILELDPVTQFREKTQLKNPVPVRTGGQYELEVQRYISAVTQKIASEGEGPDATIDFNAIQAQPPAISRAAPPVNKEFAEEVQYYDKTEQRYKTDMAIVYNNQLILLDGTPLNVRFQKK